MNVLPCDVDGGTVRFAGHALQTASTPRPPPGVTRTEVGIRPEFVHFDKSGFPVKIVKVDDLGRYRVVEVRHERYCVKMIVEEDAVIPTHDVRIAFDPAATRVYADGWVVN